MLRRKKKTDRLVVFARSVFSSSKVYLVALVACQVITFGIIWFGSQPLLEKSDEVILNIPAGVSRHYIANKLRGHYLIRSRTAFNLLVHVGYEGRPFVSGTYRLNTRMNLFEVLHLLEEGIVAVTKVTIPEGFTIKQIAKKLESSGVTKADEFIQYASTSAEKSGFANPTGSLEGYLYPDTYRFNLNQKPSQVVDVMLKTLESRVIMPLSGDIRRSGRSFHDLLTIASLIEREARIAEDRPLISSVIYNRLQKNIPLQIDATVLYSLGYHKNRVLYKDLKTQSEYNTYKIRGLPPGPIANPGLESIKAALSPADTDYLYYVASPDGSHLFAKTFDEHRANIRRVRSR